MAKKLVLERERRNHLIDWFSLKGVGSFTHHNHALMLENHHFSTVGFT